MKKLFDGLLGFEIILLVLGILFFVTLLGILLIHVRRQTDTKSVLPFFVLAVAMIAFPGIQSIKFSNDGAEIQKETEELKQDPTDPARKEELRRSVAELEARPSRSAETSLILARARFALGDTLEARTHILRARELAPQDPAVTRFVRELPAVQPPQ